MRKDLIITNARLSFPQLFTPKPFKDSPPKYSASFMIDKKDPQGKSLISVIKDITVEFKGAKFKNHAIIDGDDEGRPETKGMLIIKAKSNANRQPLLVDTKGEERTDTFFEKELYAGCYVNVDLNFYTIANEYGKMVCCSINAVQKAKDGEPFGSVAENRFSAIEEDEEGKNATDAESDVASLF